SSIAGHLGKLGLMGWTTYQMILSSVEVLLSFILTFIFVHSLPLFTVKKKRLFLKNEELVCLVILMGSVMTGMMFWEVYSLSVIHIASRYAILVLSLVGGAMLGSSLGVVTGMILSLSDPKAMVQISLLAFAGLLAGLLTEGKQWGVSIGFLLGASIITLYESHSQVMLLSLIETAIAIGFFLITPNALFRKIARWVPGTEENQSTHQEYIRRLRDVTATKVEHFM